MPPMLKPPAAWETPPPTRLRAHLFLVGDRVVEVAEGGEVPPLLARMLRMSVGWVRVASRFPALGLIPAGWYGGTMLVDESGAVVPDDGIRLRDAGWLGEERSAAEAWLRGGGA